MSELTLVIPDPHAHPDYSNARFDLLSHLIMDRKPDTIICLGDFADMPSLSSYDKGKKSFEGRRFKDDCESAIDAQVRMFAGIAEYNDRARRNKDKQYRPTTVMLGGNHDEGRISRIVNDNPEWEGVIALSALRYNDYWHTYVPYRHTIDLDGVLYSHHFATGVSGRPIGGINMGRSLVQKNYVSSTVGHSHLWNSFTDTRRDGTRVHGLSAGCFVDFALEFAAETHHLWWRGVILKHNVRDGDYDLEQISLDRLRALYG